MKYYIITPVKDEEKYIERCLKSVIVQDVCPEKWIIVNDNSKDRTRDILLEYSKKYPWIEVIDKISIDDKREYGSKILEVFYYGFKLIEKNDFDFFLLLDGDIELPSNYIEEVIKAFKSDEKIGLIGGQLYNLINGELKEEKSNPNYIRGAFKTYRKECFVSVGGFKLTWNWDGLDNMEVLFHGWKILQLRLKIVHLKPTGSNYSYFKERLLGGRELYLMRYDLLWVLLKSFQYFFKRPYVLGTIYFLYGYIICALRNEKRIVDRKLGAFISKQKYKNILRNL